MGKRKAASEPVKEKGKAKLQEPSLSPVDVDANEFGCADDSDSAMQDDEDNTKKLGVAVRTRSNTPATA